MDENYVDEIYNEHLNIFRFYRQKRDVENNFSRVLARLLIEDRYNKFHQFILNEINIDKKIKDIVYQRNLNTIKRTIDKYDRGNSNIRKCVPVMLYGSNPKLDLSQTEENTDESKKIPDITLIFDDTIVFIEVKLDDVKPKHQVENQAKGYKKLNDKVEILPTKEIKWESIINYLFRYYSNDFLIKDYLNIILENYPSWLDYTFRELFNIITKKEIKYSKEDDEENYVNIKIRKLIKQYCDNHNITYHKNVDKRGAFPLGGKFTTEMQFRIKPKTFLFESHIWTGETIEDMNEFIKYKNNNPKKIEDFINYSSKKYNEKCEIRPYILFRDYNSYILEKYTGKVNKLFKDNVCKYICKRENYKLYCDYLHDYEKEIKDEMYDFFVNLEYIKNEYYEKEGRSKKRKYLCIILGYDIVISYSKETLLKFEKDNKLFELVDNSIKIYNKYFETEIYWINNINK